VNKQVPSVGKILIMVGFALSCFCLLLFLWLAFGGPIPLKPKGYRFQVSFPEATQLAKEADVRISGVPVGKVKTIEPDTKTGLTVAVIEMDSQYAPVKSDSRAILRQKTLLGETYVELTPGSPDAKPISENGTLAQSQVSPTVELDEILRAFDPKTRKAWQTWMQAQAQGIDGYGQDINDALGNLGPFAEDTATLVDILNRQQGAVTRLISNSGVVFSALTERQGQLRSLIRNSNAVFATTAARNEQLKEAFIALPTFEDESRLTVRRLAEFARETDPLVTQLRPAARELSPTLIDLSKLAPDLNTFFRNLGPLIDASKAGFPAAQKVLEYARPFRAQVDPAADKLVPLLDFIGLYKPELTAFFANVVAATQARSTSTRVHYLRTTNPFNPENLAAYPRRLGTNRPNAYAKPGWSNKLRSGLEVYEDRHCGRAVPAGVTNLASAIPAVPTVPSVPGVPLPTPTPLPTTEQLTALVPTDLIDRINKFAFAGSLSGTVPAPPCKNQGPYTYGGETTQYPHVKAGTGR